MRRAAWIVGIIAFFLAAGYAVEGREFFRGWMRWRTRAAALLEPPSQADLQRVDTTTRAVRRDTTAGSPATPASMVGWTAGILVGVFALAIVSSGAMRNSKSPEG